MNRFKGAIMAVVAGLTILQPIQASAQVEDLIRGVGTVIAVCALTQSCGTGRAPQQQQQQQRAPTNRAPAPRAQPSPVVMADQNALNYFGFPAGAADGLSGGKTRTAIATYQGFMGFPASGSLTEYERSILTTGYQRAMAGAASQYPNLVASEGLRGLLRGFQREAMGLPVDPSAQGNVANVPQQPAAQQVVVQPAMQASGSAGAVAAPRLPTFATRPVDVSMAQHCSEINILTTANGRPETADTISDPQFALDEQFCAGRGYAISRTQQLSANIQGVSDTEMQAQCQAMVEVMAPQVARLGSSAPMELAANSADFVRAFNMPLDQLSTTGEVCLGVGYRIDDADLVMASAMILVAAEKSAYAEVFGHHLRKGFGVPANKNASDDWYNFGLAALDNGQAPAFLPTQSAQRSAVIRKALDWTNQLGLAVPGATNASVVLPAAAMN